MSDTEFFLTRMGRTYYEHTLPELVRQLQRLNENLEQLIETHWICQGPGDSEEEDHSRDRHQET